MMEGGRWIIYISRNTIYSMDCVMNRSSLAVASVVVDIFRFSLSMMMDG